MACGCGLPEGGHAGGGAQLAAAIAERDVEAVKGLLDHKPDLVLWRRLGDGAAPLQLAAATGQLELVEMLLRTAQRIIARCKSGRKAAAMLRRLLDNKNVHGQTALMLACRARAPLVVRFLLDCGASPLNFDGLHAKTALHYAVLAGAANCVDVLLSSRTIIRTYDLEFRRLRDVCLMDTQGYHRYIDVRSMHAFAPLHMAASKDDLAVAQVLLRRGASLSVRCTAAVSFGDTGGRACWAPLSTPMHIAVARGCLPMIRLFLDAMATGASVSASDPRAMLDLNRLRPCDIARLNGQPHLAALLDPSLPLRDVWATLHPEAVSREQLGPPRLAALAGAALRMKLTQQLVALRGGGGAGERGAHTGKPALRGADSVEPAQPRQQGDAAEAHAAHSASPGTDAAHADAAAQPAPRRRRWWSFGGVAAWKTLSLGSASRAGAGGDGDSGDAVGYGGDDEWLGADGPAAVMLNDWQVRRPVGRAQDAPSVRQMSSMSLLTPLPSRSAGGASASTSASTSGNNTDHGGALYAELGMYYSTAAAAAAPALYRATTAAKGPASDAVGGAAGATHHGGSECSICCDARSGVHVVGCGHAMCVQCALMLVDTQVVAEPRCPFCRATLGGFTALPAAVC